MRMPHKAEPVKPLENAHELAWIGVNVIRKDVFVDRPPRRRMHRHEIVRPQPYGQVPQKLPSRRPPSRVRILLKTFPRPVTRLLGPLVEIERLVKNRKIMIPHQRSPAPRRYQIQTFHWIWPITHDIP